MSKKECQKSNEKSEKKEEHKAKNIYLANEGKHRLIIIYIKARTNKINLTRIKESQTKTYILKEKRKKTHKKTNEKY